MFVIAMVTPGLGARVTRVLVGRRTVALEARPIVGRAERVTQVQEDRSIPARVAPQIVVLEGQSTMALVDQLTTVPVVRLMPALEVPVTPVQGEPAIPALVGMAIVAQRYANSSFFSFRRIPVHVRTRTLVKNGASILRFNSRAVIAQLPPRLG
jgi:hypothetical protein